MAAQNINSLIKKLKSIEERERSKKPLADTVSEDESPSRANVIVHLPTWREFERAAPACTLRSALFGVVQRGRRRYLRDESLVAWGTDEIKYRGERLDQADLG